MTSRNKREGHYEGYNNGKHCRGEYSLKYYAELLVYKHKMGLLGGDDYSLNDENDPDMDYIINGVKNETIPTKT